ncbi:cytochrome P450 [Gigaspora margarita]|uniref:Cytochrome P450 n=1 Tax=Gigaspora margarita TaxID=4874 RepID=A0A8H4B3W1_GIGMA|nr:cytochrome P450 [Gigaspora margarita]
MDYFLTIRLLPTCLKRFQYSEGLAEIGFYGRGVGGDEDYKGWRYNEQFFIQALFVSIFMDTARRKEIEEMPVDIEMRTDMLTSLIIANTEKDTVNVKTVSGVKYEPMIDKEIRNNLVDAFVAGKDSTASTCCCITYDICKHPNLKQKIISEILTLSSPKKSYLISDDLLKLKFCESIIKEASV